jgi:hypothetical protein
MRTTSLTLVAAWSFLSGCGRPYGTCNCLTGIPAISTTSNLADWSDSGAFEFDFGPVSLGQQLSQSLLLTNIGGSPLVILSTEQPMDPQFSVSLASEIEIQPGSDQIVPVSFKPSSAGPKSASVVVATDSSAVPTVTLTLTGTGVN